MKMFYWCFIAVYRSSKRQIYLSIRMYKFIFKI
uniref:Cytochrome b5 n=1 Tax=Triatoma infestans TaxID=30076 RepID=A0A161MD60_TRIIF